MKRLRAYRVELDPNNVQRTALLRHCGAARWVYNWALAQKKEAFEKREKMPTSFTLAKHLRAERAEVAPWLSECASYAIDSTLPHCDWAFENFFRRLKAGKKGRAAGFPKFKSRKKGIGSCQFHKAYTVQEKRVRLPKIGWLRLKEAGYIPATGTEGAKFYSATVSERAGRWFLSVQVEEEVPDQEPVEKPQVLGVDFGIKTLATCSDGRIFENPKPLGKVLRKLKRTQRALSRKQQAAKAAGVPLRERKNYQKTKRALAVQHARVSNARSNTLHVLSHRLTKTKQALVIEDLNVAGMMKNRRLAQAIGDAGWGELRRQLEYKAAWRGGQVAVADRFYPSSKTCFACKAINADLKLKQRAWTCGCGIRLDRDLNAARNLAAWTPELPTSTWQVSSGHGVPVPQSRRTRKAKKTKNTVAGAASETQNACGEGEIKPETSVSVLVALDEAGTGPPLSMAEAQMPEPTRS